MARVKIAVKPLGPALWLVSYHFGLLYNWKFNIVARFMVGRFHYGQFVVR